MKIIPINILSGGQFNCLHADLLKAIETLPTDNQTAIKMLVEKNIPRNKIARQLDWPLSKVNTKIARGLTLLKAKLTPEYFDQMEEIIKKTNQRLLRK